MTSKIWTLPECSLCLINISYDLIERSVKDERKKILIFQQIYKILENFNSNSITFNLANEILALVEKNSEIDDPYQEIKTNSNSISLKSFEKIHDDLLKILNDDSLESFKKCLIISLVGNVIDVATGGHDFELNQDYLISLINEYLKKGLKIDDSEKIYQLLRNGNKKILYCLDNAGEIVFDKFLIEKFHSLENEVVAVVKNKPFYNDVLLQDAINVNLTKTCKVIQTERFGLGFINNDSSKEFLEELDSCDIIISKGQNNFEVLSFYKEKFNKKIVFLLMTKCNPLSKFLNVDIKSFICKLVI